MRAGTATSLNTSSCDEHPWDPLKGAYKVEILLVTEDYILLAVWYTKEQAQPDIVYINLRPATTAKAKGGARVHRSSFLFIE